MTDDLDDLADLKQTMDAATPAPDKGAKAAHLAMARKNFADLQESRDAVRPTSDGSKSGLFRGVVRMFTSLSNRGLMTASTALVAIGLVAVVPNWQRGPQIFDGVLPLETAVADDARVRDQMADPAVSAPVAMAEEGRAAQPEPVIAAEAPVADLYAGATASEPNISARQAPQGYAVGGQQRVQSADHEIVMLPEANTEAFPDAEPNALKVVAEDPVSTFSIDVDTASYGVIRSSLTRGILPPDGAVRIEEMVNYFPYDYPAPELGEAFRPTVTVTDTPWNPDTQLVHIAIQGEKPVIEDRPPLNLVFLIDTSGSMKHPDKLPLLKQSLSLMLSELTEQDQVAIVTYAGSAGQVLEATPASERDTILAALDNLQAGGSTAGQAGLQQAYSVADQMAEEGEVTRVILATDGDFNVGLSDPEALETYIAKMRDGGTYLSVIGFGRGNLDDATMQALAQNGNGQAAYIDTLAEAQKVLVDQFTGALFPIADDVKIQVEFNPAQVAEYRLIGYETRALNRDDFNNDRVDAGDIGAGHSVTAIYEVTPVGSPARLSDPLRYEAATDLPESDELGYLKLRYKAPGESTSQLIEAPIVQGGEASTDMQFAAAIAGFGQLLQDSVYLGDWSYDDVIALANAAKGDDPYGYRAEAVRLMRLAQNLDRN